MVDRIEGRDPGRGEDIDENKGLNCGSCDQLLYPELQHSLAEITIMIEPNALLSLIHAQCLQVVTRLSSVAFCLLNCGIPLTVPRQDFCAVQGSRRMGKSHIKGTSIPSHFAH